MDIQTISLATAFIGSGIAAVWDLKTTEVPDQLPYAMIVIALLLFSYQSFVEWSYRPILYSIAVGLAFLAFGYLMYYLGQWGGADAWILSAIGFLLPFGYTQTMFPFPISFLFNLFLVGAAYMIVYAAVFALMNKRVIFQFTKELKANSKLTLIGLTGLFIILLLVNWYVSKTFLSTTSPSMILVNSLFPLGLTVFLFLIWRFAHVVEEYGFKKKIPASKLKIGDMLLEEKKLIGITKEQLTKIKRSGRRYVMIKEGVRFGPSFILALMFTLYFGDAILLFIRFI